MTTPAPIRRGFADLPHGQMHYRTAGEGAPLLVLHGSPGSSRQLVGLIGALGATFRVVAPDTAGNGDSTPLPLDQPEIVDLAAVLPGLLDALGLEWVDLYGSHTGAAIATELAILAPERVGRVVLDGVQVLDPDQREEMLARYAHPFPPDLEGGYLMRAFQFCRDQYLFYPWYARTREGQRIGGLPPARDLHAWLVEVLKASETYHLNYHAAFRWRPLERLALLERPALMLVAENDPIARDSRTAAPVLRDGRLVELPRTDAPKFAPLRARIITEFLGRDAVSDGAA